MFSQRRFGRNSLQAKDSPIKECGTGTTAEDWASCRHCCWRGRSIRTYSTVSCSFSYNMKSVLRKCFSDRSPCVYLYGYSIRRFIVYNKNDGFNIQCFVYIRQSETLMEIIKSEKISDLQYKAAGDLVTVPSFRNIWGKTTKRGEKTISGNLSYNHTAQNNRKTVSSLSYDSIVSGRMT